MTQESAAARRRAGRLLKVARYPRLVGSLAFRHLRDDPVNAAVLSLRLVPEAPKAALAKAVMGGTATAAAAGGGANRGAERSAGRGADRDGAAPSLPVLRALLLWDRGEQEAALGLIEHAARTGGPRRRRRLVALAIALDRPESARHLMAGLPGTDPGRPRLAALTAWREGRLRDAVAAVTAPEVRLGSHAGRTERTRRRLAGEIAVLSPDWRPPVPARIDRHRPHAGRVLHVVTNSLSHKSAGYTVRTHHIACAQRRVGLDPHVVTRLGFPVAQGFFDAGSLDVVDGIEYHRLLTWGPPPRLADRFLARNVDAAGKLVERLRPALLHAATNHVNGQIALALRDRYGLPVVYEVRGFLEETWLSRRSSEDAAEGSDRYLLSRELETHCMRAADLVVTLGEGMKAEIVGRGVDADRVLVVPNAVDESLLAPPPDPAAIRERLGVRPGEVTVGTVSSFVGYEGIDTLVRATRLLVDRGAPVRLVLVGDGAERSSLELLVDELGLRPHAVFTGRVPFQEVRGYHAALDIFVVPRIDARVCHMVTPLKPVEAMATGRPVVASDVRALAELVQHGNTGVLAEPENQVGFADAIEPLVYSADQRFKLGQAGREAVAQDRTWTSNAERYREAYARLGVAAGPTSPSA